jgi:hypothetical protein
MMMMMVMMMMIMIVIMIRMRLRIRIRIMMIGKTNNIHFSLISSFFFTQVERNFTLPRKSHL